MEIKNKNLDSQGLDNIRTVLQLMLLCIGLAGAAVPDISFGTNSWNYSGAGVSLNGASQVLTIEGDISQYQMATLNPSFNGLPNTLYFIGDIKLTNYGVGDISYKRGKLKAYSSTGNKAVYNLPELIPNNEWVTVQLQIDNFSSWSGTITLEYGMQNCTGTFEVKNPRLMETPPESTPYFFPFDVPEESASSIQINTSTKTPFNTDLFSTNSHFSWSPFTWGDSALWRLVREELPMSNMRFPGGTVGNFYNWETDEYYDDSWTYESPSRQNLAQQNWKFGFDDYALLCDSLNASSTLMFNVMQDNVHKASNRLRNRLQAGLDVKWIELGNENFYSQQAYGYIADGDQVVSATRYITHTRELKDSLKAIAPEVGIALNVNHNDYTAGSWSDSISLEDYYDALVVHSYFSFYGDELTPISGKGFLTSPFYGLRLFPALLF